MEETLDVGGFPEGSQAVTPYKKLIRILAKDGTRVRVLVEATQTEMSIPANYQVHPYEDGSTVQDGVVAEKPKEKEKMKIGKKAIPTKKAKRVSAADVDLDEDLDEAEDLDEDLDDEDDELEDIDEEEDDLDDEEEEPEDDASDDDDVEEEQIEEEEEEDGDIEEDDLDDEDDDEEDDGDLDDDLDDDEDEEEEAEVVADPEEDDDDDDLDEDEDDVEEDDVEEVEDDDDLDEDEDEEEADEDPEDDEDASDDDDLDEEPEDEEEEEEAPPSPPKRRGRPPKAKVEKVEKQVKRTKPVEEPAPKMSKKQRRLAKAERIAAKKAARMAEKAVRRGRGRPPKVVEEPVKKSKLDKKVKLMSKHAPVPTQKKSAASGEGGPTVKQFVWDLLKPGQVKSRDEIVKAIRKAKLSDHKTDEQIRAYLGVVINHLKTKNGVKFAPTPTGTYKIAK